MHESRGGVGITSATRIVTRCTQAHSHRHTSPGMLFTLTASRPQAADGTHQYLFDLLQHTTVAGEVGAR